MAIDVIYEDNDVLAVDKPAGLVVFPENKFEQKTVIDFLLEKFPSLKNVGQAPRYGVVHRLDKDTSGVLLIAKNEKTLFFLQQQFKERKAVKKYIALLSGNLQKNKGEIKTLIDRSPKNRIKQRAFLPLEPGAEGKRMALTEYRVLDHFYQLEKNEKHYYTLVEAWPKTGRKHQIRVHFNYLGFPVAGDKLYSFKNQFYLQGLDRQFLHASFLKIKLANGQEKSFQSLLAEDLKQALEKLSKIE